MPSDYDRIRTENIREYGEGTRHLAFLGTLYPDRTHFLFELLQNAEDAGARSLRFHLCCDRLELWHDGRPFTEADVRGLCGVGEGTKADDLTQIGRFGIGFKSVYAYTRTPEISSGGEQFRIAHFVRPFAMPQRTLGPAWTTLFVFPFDHPEVTSAQAFAEIARGLAALSARTLLFLHQIEEVEWHVEGGAHGCYLRDEKPITGGRRVTTLTQREKKTTEMQQWIVFGRPIALPNTHRTTSVEIAFRLEEEEDGASATVVALKSSPLVAFFPTDKETRLGFLIQGPYRTTPARDNIPSDDAWNRQLIEETAHLVVDALIRLKEMTLLTVSTLEALPIRPSDFPADGMFHPLYRGVRSALGEEPLLPGFARDCEFIRAGDAKLARGTDLTSLFYPQQLGPLFERERLYWLSPDISEMRTPELFRYLAGFSGRYPGDGAAVEPLIKDVVVTPETVARRLTARFMAKRVDPWVARLYAFLGEQRGVWGILRERPFIRLEDGSHVVPFSPTGQPNVYLPTPGRDDFPSVKREIAADPGARRFLLEFGLKEPSPLAEVLDHVLPKYARDKFRLAIAEHHEDVAKIVHAMAVCTHDERAGLIERLKETFYLLVSDAQGKHWFLRPSHAYVPSEALQGYFRDNPDIYFLAEVYDDDQVELLCEIGVGRQVRIHRREPVFGVVPISTYHGTHKRGLHGFDPDCEIDGLEFALNTITAAKAAYIWNQLLMPNIHLINGVVESDTWKSYTSPNYRRSVETSRMGHLVRMRAWLPDLDGTFKRPDALRLDDLPDAFIRSEELAAALGMGAPMVEVDAEADAEEEAAAEKLGVSLEDILLVRDNPEVIERAKALLAEQQARERLDAAVAAAAPRSFLHELGAAFDKPGKHAPFHADAPIEEVSNPALRRERTREELERALQEEPTRERRFKRIESRVWEAKDNAARIFLREQYAGCCQICGNTFSKRDGEPYFEGLYLVSHTQARWLSRPGNVLCLCPTCCAKFLHGTVEAAAIVDQVKAIRLRREGGTGISALHIRLCGEETVIRFTEAHMLDLQEIICLAESEASDE